MHYLVGLDIGGANIKMAVIQVENSRARLIEVSREYYPLWVKGKKGLEEKLQDVAEKFHNKRHSVALCMTAELCDIYSTKSEGVLHVTETAVRSFKNADQIYVVGIDLELHHPSEVEREPLRYAATNWAANAWLASRLLDCGVLVDMGSTTTSIIPVVKHRPAIWGLSDPEKLTCGELLYIGTLRTSVSEIVDKLPYKGRLAEVCHEKFASTGDVNLVLGKISPEIYITETFDGRGRSIEESAARLARAVCASLELMSLPEIMELARYVYEVVVHKLTLTLILVRTRLAAENVELERAKLVTAGLGEHVIREAGTRAGFTEILSIDEIVREEHKVAPVLPSYACALMLLDKLRRLN